jgi:hypothetical protein
MVYILNYLILDYGLQSVLMEKRIGEKKKPLTAEK